MPVEGQLAAEVAEAGRAATHAIRIIQGFLHPPLTLVELASIRALIEERMKVLRWLEVRGVQAAKSLVIQGEIALGCLTGYETMARVYFDPEAITRHHSMQEIARETQKVTDNSRTAKAAAIGYLQNVRSMCGRVLEE